MDAFIQLIIIVTVTLMAGLAMPLGASVSSIRAIGPRWLENDVRHFVIAFGGGALLSAVMFVLMPGGIKNLSALVACISFIIGGVSFMLLDLVLNRMKSSASQLSAMLIDFIPESLALGAMFTYSNNGAFLLAFLMALQNLPEGFNAYRELKNTTHYETKTILIIFSLMALLGPIAGIIGFVWLGDKHEIISIIMMVASGAILYSIFQDIAPQAKIEKHWFPTMGALVGFTLGILGHMMINV